MDSHFLGKGVVLGFAIAAPVGPIGVLCIRRTLMQGRMAGFVSGLGAATADALYGSIAGFGLTIVMRFLVSGQVGLRLIGGAFLCYFGTRTFLAKPAPQETQGGKPTGLWTAYVSTLFLTLTNPMTILSFVALFGGLGVANTQDAGATALLVSGVFLGSAWWWLLLCGGVGLLRGKLDARRLQWVNCASGIVLAVFGILALASLFRR